MRLIMTPEEKIEKLSVLFRVDCVGLSAAELEDALDHAETRWEDAIEECGDALAWIKALHDEKAERMRRDRLVEAVDYDS
jgi:hypothetical protein